MELKQNSDLPESNPLMPSMPLFAESEGQDQPEQKAPLLIQPAEHTEVDPVPTEQDPALGVIDNDE
jgi:hypothetical protein